MAAEVIGYPHWQSVVVWPGLAKPVEAWSRLKPSPGRQSATRVLGRGLAAGSMLRRTLCQPRPHAGHPQKTCTGRLYSLTTSSREWKAGFNAIRKILISEWDPIGCGVPEDEYDAYIPQIYRMIKARTNMEALASHLDELETKQMGLLPAHQERNHRVARMLLDLM